MEHDLVLEGRVVTPSGLLEGEVGVTDGMIAEIKKSGLKGARRISAEGSLIFPGFIDLHVHLREPGWERKEDFRTGTLAAAHGGVTTVADMPNNPVPATSADALSKKRALAEQKAKVGVEFYAGVDPGNLGLVKGATGLSKAFKVYLSRTTGANGFPEEKLREALGLASAIGRSVSLHCEDQSVIDAAVERLQDVKRPDVHCDKRPPEAEEKSVKAVLNVAEGIDAARVNICHASIGQTVALVRRSAEAGFKVSCEATLHHLYFERRAMLRDPRLSTNPPLRSEEDRAHLLRGIIDGSVSFLVTDHAPHLLEEKTLDGPSGVPGLDDFGNVAAWLVRGQGMEPSRLAEVASSAPAEHLGLKDRGRIEVGRRGDFTLLDLHTPHRVKEDELQTKCGWSPYVGKEFPGRVRWTLVGGEPILDDFEMMG